MIGINRLPPKVKMSFSMATCINGSRFLAAKRGLSIKSFIEEAVQQISG